MTGCFLSCGFITHMVYIRENREWTTLEEWMQFAGCKDEISMRTVGQDGCCKSN